MNFSKALKRLKEGKYVSRCGWKINSFIFLSKGRYDVTQQPSIESFYINGIGGIKAEFFITARPGDGTNFPQIALRNHEGICTHWTPTHSDLLASDWILVEDEPEMTAADIEY